MAEPETGAWLTYQEAAERLGWRLLRLKSQARRNGWEVRKRNRGGHLVRVPGELLANSRQTPGSPADVPAAEPDVDTMEIVAELRHTLGRAEGELAAELRRSQGLAAALDHERARSDRLEALLAEARKGWLERLLEAVRRRP